jgi:hypothetical protein
MSLVAFFLSASFSSFGMLRLRSITLFISSTALEQQNERALARLNTRVIKGFAKDLTGYTNCVTTNNCSPETANLRISQHSITMHSNSGTNCLPNLTLNSLLILRIIELVDQFFNFIVVINHELNRFNTELWNSYEMRKK